MKNKRIISTILIIALFAVMFIPGLASAEGEINIPDANLRTAINVWLGNGSTDAPIYPARIAQCTYTDMHLNGFNIRSLTGLAVVLSYSKVNKLDVSDNFLTDLNELNGKYFEEFNVSCNYLTFETLAIVPEAEWLDVRWPQSKIGVVRFGTSGMLGGLDNLSIGNAAVPVHVCNFVSHDGINYYFDPLYSKMLEPGEIDVSAPQFVDAAWSGITTLTLKPKELGNGTVSVNVKNKNTPNTLSKFAVNIVTAPTSVVATPSASVKVKVTRIQISKYTRTLKRGKSYTISVKTTTSPAKAKVKITYSSSNKNVAAISSTGKITAKKKGSCRIYAKAGGKSSYFTLKVN